MAHVVKYTRSDLNSFHSDLEKHLQPAFMYTVNVQNRATRDRNKSIKELQRKTAKAKLDSIKSELERFERYDTLKLPTIEMIEPEKNLFGKTSVPYEEYQEIVEEFRETLEGYKEALKELNYYKTENASLNTALEDSTRRFNELNNNNPFEEVKVVKERLSCLKEEQYTMIEDYFELSAIKSRMEDSLNWYDDFHSSFIEKLSKLSNTELSYVGKMAIPNEYVKQIQKDIIKTQEKEIQQSKNNEYDFGFEL